MSSRPSGVANVFPIFLHPLSATRWKTASILQRAVLFATMPPVSVQDSFHIWLWPFTSSDWGISVTPAPKHRLGLQRRIYGPNLSLSDWREGNRWWQNCPSEWLCRLWACVRISCLVPGRFRVARCGRCGYFSISAEKASGLLPLSAHSSLLTVWPPCHSPGSARSDDELLVPRLPERIKPLTRRQKPQTASLLRVDVCPRICVCLRIMSYMKHEWRRWPMSQGRPSHSSAFEIPHRHTVYACTLCHTLAYKSTLRIRVLIHSLSSIPSNLTTAHAVLDSNWSSLLFRTKSFCVTLLNLSFWSHSGIS